MLDEEKGVKHDRCGMNYAPLGDDKQPRKNRTFAAAGFILAILAIIGLAIFLVHRSKGSESSQPWESEVRLPSNINVKEYDLIVRPDLINFNYTGDVTLHLEVTGSTDYLLVHSLGLTIDYANIKLVNATLRDAFLSKRNEFLVLRLADKLSAPAESPLTLSVSIPFSAPLTDSLVGFYRSSYIADDGTRHWLATTKFEPTHARRAFPCLDEPGKKAMYTITLEHDAALTPLSNMPVATAMQLNSGIVRTQFQKSVPLSSYLVAFIVCDFDKVEGTYQGSDGSQKHVSVWAAPQHIKAGSAQLALDTALAVLPFYEQFFAQPYPLPKQDLISIPDFQSGAMENWGLITFRETSVLFPAGASAENKFRVAQVVAHELAHQWFGNLVTMEWWDGLWLNEGFAAFMEYIGAGHVNPDWAMQDQFFASDSENALALDAGDASHPIIQPVSNPSQINELFDAISYDKGASVLRFLSTVLQRESGDLIGEGEKATVFIHGVQLYLAKFKYGNAATDDLWSAMQAAANEAGLQLDVKSIMDNYTKQLGFPLLTVSRAAESTNKFTVTGADTRFVWSATAPVKDLAWQVPLSYASDTVLIGNQTWLKPGEAATITVPEETAGWVKLNPAQKYFYRVNYSPDLWNTLEAALLNKHANLPNVDRAGVISDVFALARGGYVSYAQALNISRYLHTETSFVGWSSSLSALKALGSHFSQQEHSELFAAYVRSKLTPVYNSLGWEDTGSQLDRQSRTIVLSSALSFGIADAQQKAQALFDKFITTGEEVPAGVRSLVYASAVRQGNSSVFEFMFNRYLAQQTVSPPESIACLNSLSASREASNLCLLLEYAMDTTKIRVQDAISVIQQVATNGVAIQQRTAWTFLKEKWDLLYDRYVRSGQRTFAPMVATVIKNFDTTKDHEEVKAFLKGRDLGPSAKQVDDAVANILRNAEWWDKNAQTVLDWLKAEPTTL